MSAYWDQFDAGDLEEVYGVYEDHDDEDYDIDFEVETEDERQEREDAEGQHFLYLDSFC